MRFFEVVGFERTTVVLPDPACVYLCINGFGRGCQAWSHLNPNVRKRVGKDGNFPKK